MPLGHKFLLQHVKFSGAKNERHSCSKERLLIRPMPCFNQKLTNSIVQEIYLTILVRKTIPDLHAVVITNGREHAFVNRTSALNWTRISSLLMEDIFSIPQYQVINE